MAITSDRKIKESQIYDIKRQSNKKSVFNFVITILEIAIKSSLTITPTKAGKQRDNKINNFDKEIWSMVYLLQFVDKVKTFNVTPKLDLDSLFKRRNNFA